MKAATFVLASATLFATGPLLAFGQADVLPNIQRGNIAVYLNPIATGLAAPLYGINPPGDATRLFVLEQRGQVLVFQNGVLLSTPALNIQSRVSPPMVITNANDERGLLGLAFHPGFNTPGSPGFGTLYTYNSELIPAGTSPTYVAPNGATQGYKNVVNEWRMSADPNVVDPASRREIISFGKNANNHNGGTIAFGPDGYLYIGLGDGGNANDVGASHLEPGGNAQNLSTPLGKMLRIDPLDPSLTPGSADPISPNGQYRIPASNPFQGAGQVREAYALGFRNPYRFAFDTLTGELIVADVGQNTVEEIDRVTLGGNFGWAVKEGDFLFNRTTGPGGNVGTVGVRSPGSPAGLIDPITGSLGMLEYDHGDGISITGGFVYRGSAMPELYGKYIFGDLALRPQPVRVDGRLFYADLTTGIINEFQMPQFAGGILPNGLTVHGFGQDASGELYAMTTNTPSSGAGGIVYRLTSCSMSVQDGSSLISRCPIGTAAISVGATGTGPFTYQWQWQPAGAATAWVNLAAGDNAEIGGSPVVNAADVGTGTLQVRPLAGYINFPPRAFRCVVSNPCGGVNSGEVTLTVCVGDFNCDNGVDGDDVIAFFGAWDTGSAAGDVNADSGVDGDDVIAFFGAWDTGC